MNIRRAGKSDYRTIAQLHKEGITTGFLSTLGIPFLSRLYWTINNEPGACVLVAEERGEITGFISGVTDIRGLYKRVLLKRWFYFIGPLMRYFVNISVIKRMLETVLYGLKSSRHETHVDSCVSELLSMAVTAAFKGMGIGKKLVQTLEKKFTEEQITEYKVVTFSLDKQSNGFYNACHFNLAGTFTHHGNVMNIYHKKLP